jgi:hypothetical protein
MSKYERKIAAWAIDRAIETVKQNPAGERTANQITEIADAYCTWMQKFTFEDDVDDVTLEAELMAKQSQGEA